jgi:hypothetical protein
MVTNYEFSSGGVRGDWQTELFAIANVDDFAFKRTLFSNRNMW